jgi:hypothetical protein
LGFDALAALNRSEAQHVAQEEARRAMLDTPPLAVVQRALQFAFAVIAKAGRYSRILPSCLF